MRIRYKVLLTWLQIKMEDLIFVEIGNCFAYLLHIDYNVEFGWIEVELEQTIKEFAAIEAEEYIRIVT